MVQGHLLLAKRKLLRGITHCHLWTKNRQTFLEIDGLSLSPSRACQDVCPSSFLLGIFYDTIRHKLCTVSSLSSYSVAFLLLNSLFSTNVSRGTVLPILIILMLTSHLFLFNPPLPFFSWSFPVSLYSQTFETPVRDPFAHF